ncbi:MAG: undecaprenyldiphospho-muramoylpentapeptide beta-N-acetylglucosaminyltransferase [Anaerovoracaceae bacterium]
MKVVLTGGCTGGHIYPALAIGDRFRAESDSNEVIYIAHQYGLETKIVPAAGYDLKIVTAQWFDRSNPIRLVKTVLETLKGRREAYRIIRDFKPDVVVSTGSFVSVPVVLAAVKAGVPVYIHEQNAFPGISNRMLSRYARKVFLGFNGGHEYFKQKEKLIYAGNPVRKDFYDRSREEDRLALDIPEGDFVITVFGGSLGSKAMNDIGLELAREYAGVEKVTVIWGTGREYYDGVTEELKNIGIMDYPNLRVSPYIDNMPAVLSASSAVISRSGALSVAETTMIGRAAIFVPSPNVTADHQYHNAKAVADAGGAVIVREGKDTSDKVMCEVRKLYENSELVTEMEAASRSIAPEKATEIIFEEIMKDISQK